VHYYITNHGERVAGWLLEEVPSGGDVAVKSRDGVARDSNSNRTNVIIRNPSWRLLYREFLKETMCEENLSFYLEVQQFNKQYRDAINDKGDNKVETIRETLAAAYGKTQHCPMCEQSLINPRSVQCFPGSRLTQ
jgi:hypothetical protein